MRKPSHFKLLADELRMSIQSELHQEMMIRETNILKMPSPKNGKESPDNSFIITVPDGFTGEPRYLALKSVRWNKETRKMSVDAIDIDHLDYGEEHFPLSDIDITTVLEMYDYIFTTLTISDTLA